MAKESGDSKKQKKVSDRELEFARHHRAAMEQRRTIEISVFGVLSSFQIALAAFAAGQFGEPGECASRWFAGVTSLIFVALYLAVVWKIEQLNIRDSRVYGPIESRLRRELKLENPVDVVGFRKAWAAWPVVAAGALELSLLAFVIFGGRP